jgi:hypothetical protein
MVNDAVFWCINTTLQCTVVSREINFKYSSFFVLKHLFLITDKKQHTKNQQFFDELLT